MRAPLPARISALSPTKSRTSLRGARKLDWIARSLAVVAIALGGCAAEQGLDGDEAVLLPVDLGTSPSIFGGEQDSGEALDAVVALRVGTGGTFELCTGALVAPNVVLTARHCVTKNVTTSVACDEAGRSANGKHVDYDEDPRTVGIYVGATPSFAQRPDAVARTIVAPKGSYLCNSDIALVVLDQPITGIEPLAVRLQTPAQAGEPVLSVGYGKNDQDVAIGTRFRKAGVRVLAQGKGISPSSTPLGAQEFEVGQSICQGDSGGPAISEETGAIIGVVSRGGSCEDDYGHIYTTTAGFDALFAEAFAVAGGAPLVETDSAFALTRGTASAPNDADDGEIPPGAASCSTARPGGAAGGAAAAFVVAAAMAMGRRRRRAAAAA
jgi:hypothetical protein